jgi:hypothetical protein
MMNKHILTMFRVAIFLIILGIPVFSARGQATGALITILDQNGKSITK